MRCHLEDITRADFYGCVLPFVFEINQLSEQKGVPVKFRCCDTLGYGVPYPGASLPRSVPGTIYGLNHYVGLASEHLEWHGHNDFGLATASAIAAVRAAARALGINARRGDELRRRLAANVRRFRRRLAAAGLGATGGLFPVQTLGGIAGVDPTRTRPSSEALLRRCLKGQDLYRINEAVDVGSS